MRDRLLARPVTPIDISSTSADRDLSTQAVLLCGWSLRETSGSAAASAELFGAHGTAGPRVGEVYVPQSQSSSQWLGDEGVLCEAGLFLHLVSGQVAGVAWVRT